MFVLSNQHVQDYGVRKWAGDDLIELQSEPLSALQALVAPYAPCILTGCELETVPDGNGEGSPAYRLHAGYVALKGRKTVENSAGTETDGTDTGSDGAETAAVTAENEATTTAEEYVKIVRVKAQPVNQPTVFLTLACTPVSRAYGNGENKAIAYDYTAEVCDVLSKVGDRPYLELAADADNPRLPDTLGVTKKLNRVGGEAKDVVVNFAEAVAETNSVPTRPELKSGSTLGILLQQIRKWFDELKDLKALAFKEKVAKSDLDADLQGELDGKVKAVDGYGLSKNDFSDGLKTKLEGFTHQAGGDLTGNYPNPTIRDSVVLTGSPSVQGNLYITGNRDEGTGNLYLQNEDGSCGQIDFGCGVSSITQSDDGDLLIHSNNNIVLEGMTVVDGAIIDYNGNEFATEQYVDTNKYTHPTHIPRSSGLYKITVNSSGHVSDVAPVIKSDIMALGIPGQDTVYTHPTHASRASGLYKITVNSSGHVTGATAVTKSDITALGIPGQDTNTVYTHPTTAGYKHIPSGGSSGQYLKYSSSGTATWANLPYHISTVQSVGTSATLYPGRIVLITSDITFKTGATDMDTLKHNNVAYASNSGWKNVKIAKNSGVHTIFSRAANDRNGITNNSGLWIFTWVDTNVVYVDFVEEATRYDA